MKKQFVNIKGIKTCFSRVGSGDKKCIILHGWDQRIDVVKSYHENLVKVLRSKGFLKSHEIIIPHLPGFGESPPPPKEGWNTCDYADWLKQFLNTVIGQTKSKDITFFTHSFGGRILIRFLQKHPKHRSKAIMAASAGIKWPPSIRQKISLFLSKRFNRAKNILPQKIQNIIMDRIFGARDWGMVKPDLKPTLRKVLKESDFRRELPKIQNKILLLWGEQDSVTPLKSGKVFASKLPHAKLITFEDGKHGIHKTHTEKIAQEIIEFCR